MSDTDQTLDGTEIADGGADGAAAPAAGSEQTPASDCRHHAATPDPDEAALRGDVDELVGVAAQRDEYLALAQRTQADFENYRKRVAKESAAAQRRGAVKLAK